MAELAARRALELLEAGGEDHAAGIDLELLRLLVVQYRSGRTGLDALHALAAEAAVQAALGLGDGVLGAEALVHLDPVAASLSAGLLRKMGPWGFGHPGQFFVGRAGVGAGVVVEGRNLLAAQVVVDAGRGLAAGGDGVDSGERALWGGVAAGEHARARCGQGVVGDLDLVALYGQIFDGGTVAAPGEVIHEGLPHGEDDRLAGDLEVGARDGLGSAAASLVGFAQPAALELDRAHLAAGADDLHGDGEKLDVHLLGQAFLDLVESGRHLIPRTPVGHGDLGGVAVEGTEPRGCPSRVESYVAPANDDHAIAHGHGPAQVELA